MGLKFKSRSEKKVCVLSDLFWELSEACYTRAMVVLNFGESVFWSSTKEAEFFFNFQPSVPLVLHKKDLKNSSGLVVFRTLEIKFHNSVDEGCRN